MDRKVGALLEDDLKYEKTSPRSMPATICGTLDLQMDCGAFVLAEGVALRGERESLSSGKQL